MSVDVRNDPEARRYLIEVDGESAGFTAYERQGANVAFLHTEIEPRFAGQGLGSRLIAAALDDVRGQGLGALPFCPFVRRFMGSHPAYADLVPEDRRAEFGLGA